MVLETITAHGSAEGVAQVARAFDAFSVGNQLPGEIAQVAHVALDEVLSNVVKAGFEPDARSRAMDVTFGIAEGHLEIVVSYEGVPFDPLARHDPDTRAALDDRAMGGLGIYLVKKLMDGVSYERIEGANRLSMKKRIRP
jgi:serine/threonine-protein kinase RsbW